MLNCGALEACLTENFARYPESEPRDAVKLLYQSQFGGGHLVLDLAEASERLERELTALPEGEPSRPLLEPLGGDWLRMNLAPARELGMTPGQIAGIFVSSSRLGPGALPGELEPALKELEAMTAAGKAPFSSEELARWLEYYRAQGYPPVHHSARYRELYHPAYRVIHRRWARLLPLLPRIDRLLRGSRPAVIAFEGGSASGKTSSAALLEELYGASVIHMDDFFLPPALRTPQRYATPGGNVHYERFAKEVLPHLGRGEGFYHRVFSCRKMAYGADRWIAPARLTIVEGAYSLHPFFGDPYDLRVFFTVEPEEQRRRILRRNGAVMYQNFAERWIPMEQLYFDHFDADGRCDLRI